MTPGLWTPEPNRPQPHPRVYRPDNKIICPGERMYDECLQTMPQVGRLPNFGPTIYPDRKFVSGIDIPAPLAFYRMDGASGAGETDTVGGLTVSNNGTVGSTTGVIGNARGAFGTNNYLSGANNSAYQITGNWTVGFWFKAGSSVTKPIVDKSGDYTGSPGGFTWEWEVEQETTNAGFYASPDGNQVIAVSTTSGAINTSTYTCVIASFTDSDNKLRISTNAGTQQESAALSNNPYTAANNDLRLGYRYNNRWSTGYLDLLSFWNVILTSTQRSNFYNAGAGREYVAGAWSA